MMVAKTEAGVLLTRFEQGSFAMLFRDKVSDRVYKLFFNKAQDVKRPDEMRRAVFESEVRAYLIAGAHKTLRRWVPKFHNVIDPIVSIQTEQSGEDRTDQFLLDCCYGMELVRGRIRKIDSLSHLAKWKRVVKLFEKSGIQYLEDASIMRASDGSFKVIDFATHDAAGIPSCWKR